MDLPDMAFVDSNCDGVDGVAGDAVFVSAQTGADGAAGTRQKPLRLLSDAVALAAKTGRSSVLAATGVYQGMLKVAPKVSVYGGYDPVTWKRTKAAATIISGAYDVTGSSFGVRAVDVITATTLQLLAVKSPTPAATSGSAYGVHAVHSPGLRLENLNVQSANGRDGKDGQIGGNGLPGQDGAHGGSGKCDDPIAGAGGAGGGSPSGYFGGDGGDGGATGWGIAGSDGLAVGGAGGPGGKSGNPGDDGQDGADGWHGADGPDASSPSLGSVDGSGIFQPPNPKNGWNGSSGTGGGGGGGGGAQVGPFVLDGGGAGSGGAGGPSVGLYAKGGAVELQGTSLWFTGGGSGGTGGNGANNGPKGSGTPSWFA